MPCGDRVNLTPSIGTAKRAKPKRKSPPASGTRYDCGVLGKLTVAEIAEHTGCSKNCIFLRVGRGLTGEELCAPSIRGVTYFCGEKHGYLTVRQIAAVVGCSGTAILNRIRLGRKGKDLVAPKWDELKHGRRPSPPKRHMMVTALRIADAFPSSIPTTKQIQAIRPMSQHHALVWRQAIATARGHLPRRAEQAG